MKRIKIISSIMMFVIFLFSLSSCQMFKEMGEKASNATQEFLYYLEHDDYEEALKLLHPESLLDEPSLESNILSVEKRCGVDFSLGATLKSSVNFSLTGYTSEFGGSTSEITYGAIIGNKECEIYVFYIDNDDGFGLYEFTVIV